MKLKHILCYILIFLSCAFANAQNKVTSGIELCNQIHSFLKKNGFSPSSQSLVVSGENTFPYNIIVTFTPEQQTSPENLLLVFFQEDIPKNQKIIKEALSRIKEADYPFSITFLFAYGEKQKLKKADMIYGTEIYLESINTNLSYTAAILDLDCEKSFIETTSKGLSSPPYLIKNSMNLYKAYGIGKELPDIILSQLSSYNFISCRILDSFFNYEIPAIKLSIGGLADSDKTETAVNIINGLVEAFSKNTDTSWEQHFMILRLFGNYTTISEKAILRIVTPTIFIWLLFIFMLFFVNQRMKRRTWSAIGKIWWSVPLTWLILVAGFFSAEYFFQNLFSTTSPAQKIYGQLIFQILLSLFLAFVIYLIILSLNYKFDERAVDYLLVISCFINQSVFILADISLSPIFIVICLLSLLALSIKNNYIHVAVFLLMIAPLIPYGHRMISASNLKDLALFLAKSKAVNFIIPLVLYPVYIVLFRIITSVRTRRKKIRFVLISTGCAYIIISAALISLGINRISSLNKNQVQEPEISMSPLGEELISLKVSDQIIFDEIIRTVDISLKEDCLLCDLLISTPDVAPILYSDNDYITPTLNSGRFRIPDNPPKEMSFKYGASKVPCRITLSAVIQGEKEDDYKFISHFIEIGAN